MLEFCMLTVKVEGWGEQKFAPYKLIEIISTIGRLDSSDTDRDESLALYELHIFGLKLLTRFVKLSDC